MPIRVMVLLEEKVKKQDPHLDEKILKSQQAVLSLLEEIADRPGELYRKKQKNLQQLAKFLQQLEKKTPEAVLQAVAAQLDAKKKQLRQNAAALEKKYDQALFDAISLSDFEIKIYRRILKSTTTCKTGDG